MYEELLQAVVVWRDARQAIFDATILTDMPPLFARLAEAERALMALAKTIDA